MYLQYNLKTLPFYKQPIDSHCHNNAPFKRTRALKANTSSYERCRGRGKNMAVLSMVRGVGRDTFWTQE